jgi:inosine-uridine nucleoside N-ribohydrolase
VYAIRFVDLLNTFFGRGGIPVGVVNGGVLPGDGKYLKRVATAGADGNLLYAHDLQDRDATPNSVRLLRQILNAQPDGSVVIVQVGFSTNLARLLESPADDISPLDGKSLVKNKVRLLSAMAGAFAKQLLAQGKKEFNVVRDIPAAQRVFGSWPTPVVISGWEVGAAIKHPGASMREDYRYAEHHPLVEAYQYYRGLENDQPTYDLTSVLYAVRPGRGYFDLSAAGRMTVDDDGTTRFHEESGGPHRFLTVNTEQIIRVREAQVMLCSQPPEGH